MIVYLPIGVLFHLHKPSARSRTTVHKVKNPYDQERYMSWLSMFLSNNYNQEYIILKSVELPYSPSDITS